MSEMGLDCAIKLNPTLLGRAPLLEILHDRLGYSTIHVPPGAFDNDPEWDEAAAIVERLRIRARELGRSFAVKLTNTLAWRTTANFSRQPRSSPISPARRCTSWRCISFAASGTHSAIRSRSRSPRASTAATIPTPWPSAWAPVTVCTDLLKPGGYTRLHAYGSELVGRMEAVGARTVTEFAQAGIDAYVESLDRDPRYRQEQVEHVTHKTGLPLGLFDCSTCDLCISACPTDANMRLRSLDCTIPFTRKHQIANFADFCNDCGNCEIVCPDLGAPQRTKMRFFGSEESWRSNAPLDGFWIGAGITRARINGVEHDDGSEHPLVQYARRAALDRSYINYINALSEER